MSWDKEVTVRVPRDISYTSQEPQLQIGDQDDHVWRYAYGARVVPRGATKR